MFVTLVVIYIAVVLLDIVLFAIVIERLDAPIYIPDAPACLLAMVLFVILKSSTPLNVASDPFITMLSVMFMS